ncbi:Protein of unknown function [Gryllus bimaculatus]|nr:Protein of unknown function [Gryllus bimaculatus]
MRSVRFARGHCRPRSKEVDISAECWYCGLRLKLKSALVEVRARQRVRLHCVVKPGKAARPDLTLSWFKNGTRLERGDRIRVKKCAEGYKGQRCELKDVSNSGIGPSFYINSYLFIVNIIYQKYFLFIQLTTN